MQLVIEFPRCGDLVMHVRHGYGPPCCCGRFYKAPGQCLAPGRRQVLACYASIGVSTNTGMVLVVFC